MGKAEVFSREPHALQECTGHSTKCVNVALGLGTARFNSVLSFDILCDLLP